MNQHQRLPRPFCSSCGKTIGSSATICPSCGAVFPVEAALQNVKSKANDHLSTLAVQIRKDPLFWARWGLALTPFFIVAPAVSLGLTLYLKEHRRDIVMMTIAILNIMLSILFWNAVIETAGEWLPSLLRGAIFPVPLTRDPFVTI